MPKQKSHDAGGRSPATDLCRTPAGLVRAGDGIRFTRASGRGGHVTVRGVDQHGRWLYCTDSRGGSRVVRLEDVTRVCDPPLPQPQRDFIPKRRRR